MQSSMKTAEIVMNGLLNRPNLRGQRVRGPEPLSEVAVTLLS